MSLWIEETSQDCVACYVLTIVQYGLILQPLVHDSRRLIDMKKGSSMWPIVSPDLIVHPPGLISVNRD